MRGGSLNMSWMLQSATEGAPWIGTALVYIMNVQTDIQAAQTLLLCGACSGLPQLTHDLHNQILQSIVIYGYTMHNIILNQATV